MLVEHPIELRSQQKRHGKEPQGHEGHADDPEAAQVRVSRSGGRHVESIAPAEPCNQEHSQDSARKDRNGGAGLPWNADAVQPGHHRDSDRNRGSSTHDAAGQAGSGPGEGNGLSREALRPPEPYRQKAEERHPCGERGACDERQEALLPPGPRRARLYFEGVEDRMNAARCKPEERSDGDGRDRAPLPIGDALDLGLDHLSDVGRHRRHQPPFERRPRRGDARPHQARDGGQRHQGQEEPEGHLGGEAEGARARNAPHHGVDPLARARSPQGKAAHRGRRAAGSRRHRC